MFEVEARPDGGLVVTMPEVEAMVLCSLPLRLREVLESPDFPQKTVARLFPSAYKDKAKEAEYRKLLGDDLRRRKLEGIALFEKTFAAWKRRGDRVQFVLEPGGFDLWIGVVNDMRLLLGTELGIEDESWGRDFDPEHPQAGELALLHYLSMVEERLLSARGFSEPELPPFQES